MDFMQWVKTWRSDGCIISICKIVTIIVVWSFIITATVSSILQLIQGILLVFQHGGELMIRDLSWINSDNIVPVIIATIFLSTCIIIFLWAALKTTTYKFLNIKIASKEDDKKEVEQELLKYFRFTDERIKELNDRLNEKEQHDDKL